jgi:alkanesulfonate monooxygenase SsuD/methylene tetrahydromethanopterin reductase-like flavin-dependent oxidoreductase (luciferase family)
MSQIQLRHGIFLPPFHPMDENPAACMDRDLELMQWLDRLGFHEAWIGEHHSAGWDDKLAGTVHRGRRGTHAVDPVRHRRDFAAVP